MEQILLAPLKILIVDDDKEDSFLWERTLKKRFQDQVAVETCTDGNEALKRIDSNLALLLLDWHMPSIDGREIAQLLRQKGFETKKIVVLSGAKSEDLHKRFPMGDCLAVIQKGDPRQREILLEIVNELLTRQSLR